MNNEINELRDKRIKRSFAMRSVMDFTMGIIYVAVAAFLIFAERFGYEMNSFDITFRYIFGGLCAFYGFWRIYRGFKKDYI